MRKTIFITLLLAILFALSGCPKREARVVQTIDNGLRTYYELSDGTWQADGVNYKYRLEISGRMPNAACDSAFVYLSNIENITFEQAWKAAGLSSSTEDYFDKKDAVLVSWTTD